MGKFQLLASTGKLLVNEFVSQILQTSADHAQVRRRRNTQIQHSVRRILMSFIPISLRTVTLIRVNNYVSGISIAKNSFI